MSSDYVAIRRENEKRYGSDIGRIGPMLLADRYDDRTHFIFELLQNAEDALRKRDGWEGPREISFSLNASSLTISHFGRPFDEADVRGICGIAESTKDQHSIGRFGIGFKSVYTFTERPEIHSGSESFGIENYVWPTAAAQRPHKADETQIWLPLKPHDATASADLERGFKGIGPSSLLFLKHIEQIGWSIDGGASGVYMRSPPEAQGPHVRTLTVIGQETAREDVDETWLLFDRDVFAADGKLVGSVELAFAVASREGNKPNWTIQPIATSPLVVFFPTVLSTHLGFLVQGPYRTTPSRDNIPRSDPWNQYLVGETAVLLIESLRWLRDEGLLDVSGLKCLPLDGNLFPEGSMFAPVFEAVRDAMKTEPLLPKSGGGYVEAARARLARTQEIRDLFDSEQIAALFDGEASAWLSGDITQDRAPDVRNYVMDELDVIEVTPATLVPRLTKGFLEDQPDEWMVRLYEFLDGQTAVLSRRLESLHLVRLTDGSHVTSMTDGKANAFLPGSFESGFPTIRPEVCTSVAAKRFLGSLGLTEPDPVDDVIWNLLPKYQQAEVDVDAAQYGADIERILKAFGTDSVVQREKLLMRLRETSFVMVADAGDGVGYVSPPDTIYLATDRLKSLFAGVPDVFIVDDSYACLRGEPIRELLEACGALRYLRPEDTPAALGTEERTSLRVEAGHAQTSYQNDRVIDWTLKGLDGLLRALPTFNPDERTIRAQLLWDSLSDLEDRRGHGIFVGSYRWTHHGSYLKEFPSAFLRTLNAHAWVPDAQGGLHPPSLVVFESLGWKANPFLLSKIGFKPALLDELALQAGIDPAALDLLKKLGITSVADLTARLGIGVVEPHDDEPEGTDSDIYGEASDLYGDDMPEISPGTPDPDGGDGVGAGAGGGGNGTGTPGGKTAGGSGTPGKSSESASRGSQGSGSSSAGGPSTNRAARTFVSYLGAHPDDEGPDPDGLGQAARMQIEEQAIVRILALEPKLKRTPAGNVGFDLYDDGATGDQTVWVEVKAMTGSLADRPVGLSRAQFSHAAKAGSAYWLYVVEHAQDEDRWRILRIQDPVSKAKTFTFDQGWLNVAALEPPARTRG